MKLRLRSSETKETLRIDVPPSCTLQQLKEIVFQRLPNAASSSSAFVSIRLSLNNKDELQAPSFDVQTLQSLGITSGDLVFFTLNPDGFSPKRVVQQSRPQDSRKRIVVEPLSGAISVSGNSSLRLEKSCEGKAQDMNEQKNENYREMDVEEEYINDLGSVPEFVGTGRTFSIPGFLRKVFSEELNDGCGLDRNLLVIAVHAVLLESGFVRFDPVSNVAVKEFQFKHERSKVAFRTSIFYSLPDIINRLSHSNSSAISEKLDHKVNIVDAVVLKFQTLGKFVNVYGSLVNGSGAHWVQLNEEKLVPFLNVAWANCGLTDQVSGKDGVSGTSPEKEVFKFWTSVKDKLALPLLIDLCEKAGLGLPPCFARLPTELKLKVLESLPGNEIAKLSCVSSELRYLASSDDLWRSKYLEQFGSIMGPKWSNNWKDTFAKTWEYRKRRPVLPDHRLRPVYPIGPGVPFRLFWMPRIIGGDHDIGPAAQGSRHIPPCNFGGSPNLHL